MAEAVLEKRLLSPENPGHWLDGGYERLLAMSWRDCADVQLKILQRRFAELVPQVAALEKLAKREGITSIDSFEDALPSGARDNGNGPNSVGKNPPLYYIYEAAGWKLAFGAGFFGKLFVLRLLSGLMLLAMLLMISGALVLRTPSARRLMGKTAALLLLLLPISAFAVPFTFTNGTVADATQVNQNFSSLETRIAALEAKHTLAYAHVNANGTIDKDSGNITGGKHRFERGNIVELDDLGTGRREHETDI